MSGFIKGEDRFQATLFPERLDDYVAEDSAVRVIDVFLDDLDLSVWDLRLNPTIQAAQPTIHQQCSSCLCTVISTVCNRAAGWKSRHNAMLS
jgi:hypothetical protein